MFPLHQLIDREGPQLVFETYEPSHRLPDVGSTYDFYSWWLPEAMDAVRDMSAAWQYQHYPDYGGGEDFGRGAAWSVYPTE